MEAITLMRVMGAFAFLNFCLLIAAIVKAYELVKLYRKSHELFLVMQQINAGLQGGLTRQQVIDDTIHIVNGKLDNVVGVLKTTSEDLTHSVDLMGEELDRLAHTIVPNQTVVGIIKDVATQVVTKLGGGETSGT